MCESRESYIIKVDSTYSSSATANSFVAYLPIPLRNVVKVELLSASVTPAANTSPVLYIHAEELISKFVNRAAVVYALGGGGLGNVLSTVGSVSSTLTNESKLAEALVAVPVDTTRASGTPVIYTSGGFFPTEIEYIDPIRQLSKLTINTYTSSGSLVITSGTVPSFFVFRLTCANRNSCLY